MKRTILVSCEDDEKRVVIVEDNNVVEVFIERSSEEYVAGNIYLGKVVTMMPSLDAAFIDIGLERSAYLPFAEMVTPLAEKKPRTFKKGDSIIVQVMKDPIGTKGAKCTMDVSFPGRYLVYKPFDKRLGVSKSIDDRDTRSHLRTLFRSAATDAPRGGYIVRTEAKHADEKTLQREITYLTRLWNDVQTAAKRHKAPALIRQEFGVVFKVIRDKMTQELDALIMDSLDEYEATVAYVNMVSPEYAKRIRLHTGRIPLFKQHNVESVFDKIMRQKIFLPSGGYIIIQEAESLCAIDVNSGGGRGASFEETIIKTNREAVQEVALQLRLRNIGGIIVIDFIDMMKRAHRQLIIDELTKAMKYDKAKITILPITALGLVEMTRQRKRESIASFLSEICPACTGTGRVYSRETLFYKIRREIKEIMAHSPRGKLTITLNPYCNSFFDPRHIKQLKRGITVPIKLVFNETVRIGEYSVIHDI